MSGITEQELERVLRRPARPDSPDGLKDHLLVNVRTMTKSRQIAITPSRENWLRRWWPVWAGAAVSLVCAVVMAIQQREIQQLKQTIQTLSTNLVSDQPASRPSADNGPLAGNLAAEQQEISQLKEQKDTLSTEISRLERVQSENQTLRTQLAAQASGTFTPEELAGLQQARDRADSIQCVNNLKQMGLAVRIWEGDNNDMLPPDIICMSNELSTPRILVCPSDTSRQAATSFSSYTDANCSYEFLAASGGKGDDEPNRVLFRCPIHGTVCLCDGSVQMGVAKKHPDWFVQRDGKLYLEPPAQ